MVVPVSVKVSNLIENTYKDTIDSAKTTEFTEEEIQSTENTNESTSEGWNGLVSKFKDGIANIENNVSDLIKKGEKTLSNFIDAIAILLITSCVIPILVLIFFVWLVKMIFGLNFQYPEFGKIKSNNEKNQ